MGNDIQYQCYKLYIARRKSMKFTSKIANQIGLMLTVLAVVLCFGIFTLSSTGIATQARIAAAAEPGSGPVLTLSEYVATYSETTVYHLNDAGHTEVKGVLLPKATTSSGDIAVTAKSQSGLTARCYADSEVEDILSGKYLLVPSYSVGKYNVTYTATDGEMVTSRTITVSFNNKNVAFEDITSTNTKNIIPSVVNPNTEIKFGYPNIILGGDTDTKFSSSDATKGTLTVKVVTPTGTETALAAADGVFKYTPTTVGTYKVMYSYKYTATNETISKSYNFRVADATQFDSTKIDLKINSWTNGSLDSLSLSVGEEQTLPTPVVINTQDNEEVATYNTIKVEYYNENASTQTKWETVVEAIDDYNFTPTKVGNYRFTYTCKDFFGNEVTRFVNDVAATLSSSTLGLKLSAAAYDPEDASFDYDAIEDAEYMIPTYVVKGSTVTFPALAVKSYGDFELNYTLTIAGTTPDHYYELNDYEFNKTGTFTVTYQVAYKDNPNQRVTKSYEIEVLSADIAKELKGTLTGLPNSAKAGATINFGITSSDKFNDDTSTYNGKTADQHLKTEVTATLNAADVDVVKNDDGTYSIDLPTDAANDADLVVTLNLEDSFGQTFTTDKTIKVYNYSADTTAPTFDAGLLGDINAKTAAQLTFARGTEVAVLPLAATDAQSRVAIDVLVKNNNNTILKKSVFAVNSVAPYSAAIQENQFKFTLGNTGIYTITYVATDENNNQAIFTYNILSQSDATPGVTLKNISSTNIGQTVELADAVTVTLDGATVDYNAVLVTDTTVDETNIVTYINNNGIAMNTVLIRLDGDFERGDTLTSIVVKGDVALKVWAYGDNADENKRINVNDYKEGNIVATDTTKPQFNIGGDYGSANRTIALDETTGEAEVQLGWFEDVNDAALGYEGSGVKSMTITATYESDSDPVFTITKSPTDDVDLNDIKFTATKNGKINIVYTVADYSNNEASTTLVYSMGDCIPPTVTIGDQDVTQTIKIKSGEKGTFTLDLEKLVATDGETTYNYGDSGITWNIKLTKDGVSVDASETTTTAKTWNELDAGNYILTITATDTAGNVSYPINNTFKVEAQGSTKVTSTTVWGTILIILALVILAGVIFFFVRPTKGKVKLSNKKTTKATDDQAQKDAE